jgi:hypothetical protein
MHASKDNEAMPVSFVHVLTPKHRKHSYLYVLPLTRLLLLLYKTFQDVLDLDWRLIKDVRARPPSDVPEGENSLDFGEGHVVNEDHAEGGQGDVTRISLEVRDHLGQLRQQYAEDHESYAIDVV